MNNIVRYTLRINRKLFSKFRYIAGYQGRSANKEIEQYMKRTVEKFEMLHGTIKLSDDIESDEKDS